MNHKIATNNKLLLSPERSLRAYVRNFNSMALFRRLFVCLFFISHWFLYYLPFSAQFERIQKRLEIHFIFYSKVFKTFYPDMTFSNLYSHEYMFLFPFDFSTSKPTYLIVFPLGKDSQTHFHFEPLNIKLTSFLAVFDIFKKEILC